MQAAYDIDRAWSDQYLADIRRIVGPLMLEPSSDFVDQKQATDLVMLEGRSLNIACRVRRGGYFEQYPYDFTVRYDRAIGAKTEWTKIVEGHADWMFYAHAAASGGIGRYMVICLKALRAAMIRLNERKAIESRIVDNGDGTSFLAIDARTLPPRCILATNIAGLKE